MRRVAGASVHSDDATPNAPVTLLSGESGAFILSQHMKPTKKDMRKAFNLYANGSSITQIQLAYGTTREKVIDMLQLSGIDTPVECILPQKEDQPFTPFPDTLLPSFTEKQLEAMTPDILRATLSAYANEMGRRVLIAERNEKVIALENRRLKDELVRILHRRKPRGRISHR